MKEAVRTSYEMLWAPVVFLPSVAGLHWVVQAYLGLSWKGTILFLAPTTLLCALAAVYSHYVGWQRWRIKGGYPPSSRVVQHLLRFFILILFPLIPASVAAYFLYLQDISLALLFGTIAGLLSHWVHPKLSRETNQF